MQLVKYNKTVKKAKRKLRLIRKSQVKVARISKLTIMNRLRRLLRRTPSTSTKGLAFGTFSRLRPLSIGGSVTPTSVRMSKKLKHEEDRFKRTGRYKLKYKRMINLIRKELKVAA